MHPGSQEANQPFVFSVFTPRLLLFDSEDKL